MIKLDLNEKEKGNLTKEEIEIAKARKLEILMLPILRRNMEFFYAGGNLKGKASAYRNSTNKKAIEKVLRDKNGSIATVCKPLCEMVVEILQENGIDAQTVSCDTDMFRHTDVLITTKSGKQYIVNYLEDMENIQTGMKTPNFVSKKYYEDRYKKFEKGLTTDGKSLENISFLDEKTLDKIDTNLGYKQQNMYMNTVIEQIKSEFLNFKEIMAENEWVNAKLTLENEKATQKQQEQRKNEIYEKYRNMTSDEELEAKMDWIFNYFNHRDNINGHADFVMYYSRLLLKEVLTEEEYSKITRYDCFAKNRDIPKNSIIKDVLDFENPDNKDKNRFCMVTLKDKAYVFSTKPNEYVKLSNEQIQELKTYANFSKSEKPSDLVINLMYRGNALPLVFHPLGGKLLNERAELIDKNLEKEERERAVKELSDNIKTTDEPITSILIPYPNGNNKYVYINENDEFVVKTNNKETIYHYNEEKDSYETEDIELDER